MPAYVAILISFVLLACQSPRVTEFEKVNLGEIKSDVLNTVGNPTSTLRKSGQDRWVYRLYDKDILVEKWLVFQDGYVVYKGDPVTPFISAEEQDRINLQQNVQLNNLRLPSSNRPLKNKLPTTAN